MPNAAASVPGIKNTSPITTDSNELNMILFFIDHLNVKW
jgi:hypothetical protein